VLFVLQNGLTISSLEFGRNLDNIEEGKLMSPKSFLYGSLYLYPLIRYLDSKKDKLIYHISIFLFVFFSLAMGSRGTTIIGIIVVILSNLSLNKANYSNKIFSFSKVRIFFSIFIILFILYQIPILSSSVKYLIYRLLYGEEYIGASRMEEVTEIFKHLNLRQLIYGKGLGGANNYWIFSGDLHGVNTVHIGWMHLILKGGVLLLCLIYGRLFYAIKIMWKNNTRPYCIILIAFLLTEFSHTNFNSIQNISYMFIAMSCSFYKEKT
jgi:hypothetical protein